MININNNNYNNSIIHSQFQLISSPRTVVQMSQALFYMHLLYIDTIIHLNFLKGFFDFEAKICKLAFAQIYNFSKTTFHKKLARFFKIIVYCTRAFYFIGY